MRSYRRTTNPLVGFKRLEFARGSRPTRHEAVFRSSSYERTWEEAVRSSPIKFRVYVVGRLPEMREFVENIFDIDAHAKDNNEVVIVTGLAAGYTPESTAQEGERGSPTRVSRPSPFMILHNLAEQVGFLRAIGKNYTNAMEFDKVDTWAGRNGALRNDDQAQADLFAKYVMTGKFAYSGKHAKEALEVVTATFRYLEENPGIYYLGNTAGETDLPLGDDMMDFLQQNFEAFEKKGKKSNPRDIKGRHMPERVTNPRRLDGSMAQARALIDAGACGDFDDDNFYHVTTESRLNDIARYGLVPNKPAKFSRLEAYSAGKVFVSHGLATARVWQEYIRDMVDEDEQVVVLRIRPEAKLYGKVHLDEKGTEDAGCSFYVTSTIKPQHLEVVTEPRMNPTDLKGRHVPERYVAGLPAPLRATRLRELTASRDAYRRGDYSELPSDRIARKMGLVKKSAYSEVAEQRGIEWRGDEEEMARRVCAHYRVTCTPAVARAIRSAFNKGLAAWKSGGHRPGATAQNWAVARVASLVVGGKTSLTADRREFASFPPSLQRAIASRRAAVVTALLRQGRDDDAAVVGAA